MLLRCSCLTPRGLAPGDVQRLLSEPAPEGAPGALECCVCLQEILPSSPSLRHLENARSDFCWPKVEELEWFTYRCTIKYAYIILYNQIIYICKCIYISIYVVHLRKLFTFTCASFCKRHFSSTWVQRLVSFGPGLHCCSQLYHHECIVEWLAVVARCPMCRETVRPAVESSPVRP